MEKDTYCDELKQIHEAMTSKPPLIQKPNVSDYLTVIRDLYVYCSNKPPISTPPVNVYCEEFNYTDDIKKS